MYLHHTPIFVQKILPSYTWRRKNAQKVVYLTFDDGPIPEVTTWVLQLLALYNAKATFFCVGENIQKHPEVYKQVLAEGHSVGNHTYNHLKGMNVSDEEYIENTKLCAEAMSKEPFVGKLFRPPYGKIKFSQTRKLKTLGYEIILWDVLTGDFDAKLTKEKCLSASLNATKSGSIVVFHDSLKTYEKLQFVLPQYLKVLSEQGYQFRAL